MNGSKSIKILFALIFSATLLSSCGIWQTSENNRKKSNDGAPDNLKSEIPFTTKEPKVYQADFVITNYLNGEKTERITSVARNGDMQRLDFPNGISFLQSNENESFLLDNEKKVYAKMRTDSSEDKSTDETLKDFLTTKWLNEKQDAKFENLGEEAGLIKYRVILDNTEKSKSETLIYFDKNLQIPIKQEFMSVKGDQKTKMYSMEIRNLKLETDEDRFKLPKDFKQVSVEDFQSDIRKNQK